MQVCYSLRFFYEVKGAKIYNGETGYIEQSFNDCTKADIDLKEHYQKASEEVKVALAQMLKVPTENIRAITLEEYQANTDDEEGGD